jgi:membrane protein DedA with SNARE-associated domain
MMAPSHDLKLDVQVAFRRLRHREGRMTAQLTDWIAAHGIAAVFLLMAVDAVLPAGGELVMLFAGALAAGAVSGGHLSVLGHTLSTGLESYLVIVAAGTLGYVVGSLAGWALGVRGGRGLIDRHGGKLHLGPARFARAERWFARFGPASVFLGRLTPLVRSFVSIPAGVLRFPFWPYLMLTFAASLLWAGAFAGAGWALGGNWEQVNHAFRYADYAVVAAVLAVAAVLLRRTVTGHARPR